MLKKATCCVLVLFSALFSAYGYGYIATLEIEAEVAECNGDHLNTHECARGIERKTLSKQPNSVHRSNRKLVINAASKTITLIDNPADSGEKFIGYTYLG